MKYGILVLSALVLLGIGLASSRPARADGPAQAATTPAAQVTAGTIQDQGGGQTGTSGTPFAPPSTPGAQGNGAPPGPGADGAVNQGVGSSGNVNTTSPANQVPTNVTGREPNDLVGFFPAIILPLGIIGAGIAAIVATRRDAQKAKRIRGRDAPGRRH
jgi:hypothetical protein